MIDLKQIYQNKTVLITGHTGFKGSWLSLFLNYLGAKVIGYSLDPYSSKDNYVLSGIGSKIIDLRGDINDYTHLENVFKTYQPDYVFHLAAQPLVRLSYEKPLDTFETNLLGSLKVLECVRKMDKQCTVVMITTDKVYENNEDGKPFKEDDKFGGYDPYSASKATCEIGIASYRRSFMNPDNYDKHGKCIVSVRAGNVVGGGDWNKDRIVPDCIKAIEENKPIVLRNPKSIRPWEHVLEPLYGYLIVGALAESDPIKYCSGYNFGPSSENIRTVEDVAKGIINYLGKGCIEINQDNNAPHEANVLLLNTDKAREELGWKSILSFEKTIEYTCDWYKNYKTENVYDLCIRQIKDYLKEVKNELQ